MAVAFFPVVPVAQHPCRVLHHRRRIGSDAPAVKRRLRQPPLAQPELSFAGEQAFAEDVPVRTQHAAFYIFAGVGYERFLDCVRMVDENRLEIQDSDSRDVAIFASEFGEVFERSVIERTERPPPEPFGGSWRKIFASRVPHATMLCRGLVLVKRVIHWME